MEQKKQIRSHGEICPGSCQLSLNQCGYDQGGSTVCSFCTHTHSQIGHSEEAILSKAKIRENEMIERRKKNDSILEMKRLIKEKEKNDAKERKGKERLEKKRKHEEEKKDQEEKKQNAKRMKKEQFDTENREMRAKRTFQALPEWRTYADRRVSLTYNTRSNLI